jgi:nitrogen fixation protein NifX
MDSTVYRVEILRRENELKGKSMKVAFATKDMNNIDEHFGWAKQFAVYEVNKDGFSLASVVKTQEGVDQEDEKINSKIEAINDCAIVYCQAIGPTAAAKVIKNHIHPIKVEKEMSIEEALESLKKMLNGNPPPWIKRIIMREEGITNE